MRAANEDKVKVVEVAAHFVKEQKRSGGDQNPKILMGKTKGPPIRPHHFSPPVCFVLKPFLPLSPGWPQICDPPASAFPSTDGIVDMSFHLWYRPHPLTTQEFREQQKWSSLGKRLPCPRLVI